MRLHPRVHITAVVVTFGLIGSGLMQASAEDWSTPSLQPSSDVMREDAAADLHPLPDAVVHWHLDDAVLACDSPGWGLDGHGISYSPGVPSKPRREQPGDIDRGDCPPYRYGMSDCERAGKPHQVAWWAVPSVDSNYSAGFVGGGAAFGGRGRMRSEGTWGLDYHGSLPLRRVWLKWTCGRSQAGEGAYQTDGHTGPLSQH